MTLRIGTNVLDSGAPYYQVYETKDGGFMGVGAIEGRFYKELLKGLGVDPSTLPAQNDMSKWPEMKTRFAKIFKSKTRNEWTAVFEGKDACVAPVLDLNEVDHHPHNRQRELLITVDGVLQPGPAPRLSRTPGAVQGRGTPRGSESVEILEELGYADPDIEALLRDQVVEKAG